MSGDELKDGISGAHILICNDYEFELIREKPVGKRTLGEVDILIVTKGENGSSITKQGRMSRRPAASWRITGVGDVPRRTDEGIRDGAAADAAARIGSVAATCSSTSAAPTIRKGRVRSALSTALRHADGGSLGARESFSSP
jgi:hypothetical protein